jgi:hypothetical protein
VCLFIVRRVFRKRIPTISEFAAANQLSVDTIRRAASLLVRPVFRILKSRRPGPQRPRCEAKAADPEEMLACRAINAIIKALLPTSVANLLNSPQKRGRVVEQVLHFKARGARLERLAGFLGLSIRTLRRWIDVFRGEGNGQDVPHESRRPDNSPRQIPGEIQKVLWGLRQLFEDDSTAALTGRFNRCFKDLLKRHDLERISEKTAARYLNGARPRTEAVPPEPEKASPRGHYRYPEPLTMAWIDTKYFEVAGTTVHIVGAMEASARLALAGDVFVQENAETTVAILELSLTRVPGLAAVLRDRGKPYLNEVINALLETRGILPINAHPYFPIDKAALERFWGTLAEWLRHAIRPFEEECQRQDRIPSKDEVVSRLRPALRVFFRAYNLLPQAYFEDQSPIQRIDAFLRGEGEPGLTLSDLRGLAMAREGKDDLLVEIRDALQIQLPIERIRRDFVGISKDALRAAISATSKRLIIDRDPTIRSPYAYLIAVARIKEREHQQADRMKRALEEKNRRFKEVTDRREAELEREDERRTLLPEECLRPDLERWVRFSNSPFKSLRRFAMRRLAETLQRLRAKMADAFQSFVDTARERIPHLLAQLGVTDPSCAETLATEFAALAEGAPPFRHEPTPLPPAPGINVKPVPSCHPIGQLVRTVLAGLQRPHDPRTYVPP